jgi:hypothetical protein
MSEGTADLFDAPVVMRGQSIVPRDGRGNARPTIEQARAQAQEGMRSALEHANSDGKWADLAYAFLLRFIASHPTFISEDVSDASIAWGMVQPPTLRAWGRLYVRAVRAGLIEQDGCGRSRRRHASICPRWRAL